MAEAAAAPAVAENFRAVAHSEIHTLHRAAGVAPAVAAEKLAAHQAHLPCDAHVRIAVIGARADGARAVGAVIVVVHRVAIAIHGIDAVYVVDVPVVIIVHPVAGDLVLIDPHLPGQILVGVPDSRIDHCHDDVCGTSGLLPSGQRAHVDIGRAAILTGIAQTPQPALRKALVTGRRVG